MAEQGSTLKEDAVRDTSPAYSVEAEAASTEAVPPRYKRTEVGVIPEDWVVASLANLGYWSGGATPSMRVPSYWKNGNIPWVSSGDVKVPKLATTEQKISKLGLENSSTSLLPVGAIIIVTRSGILRKFLPVAQLQVAATINQDIKGLVPNTDIDASYILYAITWSGPEILKTCQKSGTTVESIEFQWLKAYSIPLPEDSEEQRAITTALSDADALIESLDRLIAKKRAIKQAAMQQLLTGQTRLPGFTGDWETKRLGELLTVRHGRNQSEVEKYDGKYPILATGGEIGRTDTALYERPSVLIGRKGTIDQPRYMGSPFWTVDTLFYTEMQPSTHAKFMFYLFTQIPWREYNEASGVPSLNGKTIEKIQVLVPNFEEQTVIATVLSDMDAEIEALEHRRDKARQIKQGMMQQLLTGRTRLVKPKDAA